MLLRHARSVTIWYEALRRMESFSRKTRSVDCEENTTLSASDGEELASNGMVNESESLKSAVT